MTLLLIFVSAAFAVAALYFSLAPFLASREEQARAELIDDELKQVEQLVATKAVLLQSLREIEFEYETAKMSPEDYERFRTSLERQAVGVMRELDRIHGGRGWEEKIDRELEERLGRPLDADEDSSNDWGAADDDEDSAEAPEVDISAAPLDSRSEVEDDESDEAGEEESDEAIDEELDEISRAEEETLVCESCSAELATDDRFCSKCGTPTNFDEETQEAAG